MKPLSAKPPSPKDYESKLSDFVSQANYAPELTSYEPTPKKMFPWEEQHVRDDLKKMFNLRFSERDYIKLEYLAQRRKESLHHVIMSYLIPAINKDLKITD